MKFKTVLLLSVAIGCGLVAMLGVQQALSGGRQVESKPETVDVLVATTDIPAGAPLDGTNTKFRKWPKDSVPEGAVTSAEEFEERALKTTAVANEVIMLAKLGEKGAFGASIEIPDGMRVVTVSVNLTKTHSGLIRPGDRVDVLVTYKVRRPETGMISKTKTVLEYLKVFAMDSVRHASDKDIPEINAKNISLLVTPEQAALLMLAENKGQLHLALRSKGDQAQVHVPDVTDEDLDSIFGVHGVDDPKDAEEAVVYEPAPAQSDRDQLHAALAEEQNLSQPSEQEPIGQEEIVEIPEKPKWKIEIFAGDTRRIEEVDLPEEPGFFGLENEGLLKAPTGGARRIWRGLRHYFTGT